MSRPQASPSVRPARRHPIPFLLGVIVTALLAWGAPAFGHAQGGNRALQTEMQTLLPAYDAIRSALARDSVDGIREHARTVRLAAGRARQHSQGTPARPFGALETAARRMEANERDVERARDRFADLSRALIELLDAGIVETPRVHVFTCPMARGYGGWVQLDDHIENPYMGTRMSSCGSPVDRP